MINSFPGLETAIEYHYLVQGVLQSPMASLSLHPYKIKYLGTTQLLMNHAAEPHYGRYSEWVYTNRGQSDFKRCLNTCKN